MDQWIVYLALLGALVLFIDGRWRYDVVALAALLFVTLMGIVPQDQAFVGFGHPAVVTVAAVLVVTRGLNNAGVVDILARSMNQVGRNPTVLVGSLTLTTALCSAIMNNIGALALVMPVGMRLARKNGHSPSILLMPLAFGSLLGGLITVIGTPANVIIATFRATTGRGVFTTFDFTPVGLVVMLAGVAFISLIGWRLIPMRDGRRHKGNFVEMADYITEVRITPDSKLVGQPIRALSKLIAVDVLILVLIQNNRRVPNPSSDTVFQAGDVLIIETDPDDLKELIDVARLELVGDKRVEQALTGEGDVVLVEVVVRPDSPIINHNVQSLNLRWRYGVNLLAIARQGEGMWNKRLMHIRFRAGDVLLLQGRAAALPETLQKLGCLPLAERDLPIGKPRRLIAALGIFGVALGAVALNLLTIQVAMMSALLGMILSRMVSLKEAYEAIDWPILILLGAMIPLGTALEVSGGAAQIADLLLGLGGSLPPVFILIGLMLITMTLSDVVNNAATAVLMAPIAVNLAAGLGVSPDPFLMGVAVGASCAFLTPIGHQSNTLVLGPGGYHFGDYWRMGLPLTVIVLVVSVAMILIVWPL